MDLTAAVNSFHRTVLTWDYFRLGRRSEEGLGVYDELVPVPASFADIQEYKRIFEPLILEECGAQVLRGIEEGFVLKPHPAVVASCEQRQDFHHVRIRMDAADSALYGDNDLVLLCKDNPESETCREQLHALCFCEGRDGEAYIKGKLYLTDNSQAGNSEGVTRARSMRAGIETRASTWYLLRLFNMSTITREWVALQHAHLTPFSNILLRGEPSAPLPVEKRLQIPPAMRGAMEQECNKSQMAALQTGLDGSPMVLIQGPPGTGKTRTILNLLSVVMHAARHGALELLVGVGGKGRLAASDGEGGEGGERRQALWRMQSPWSFGDVNVRDLVRPNPAAGPAPAGSTYTFGLTARAPVVHVGAATGPRARVLVCAPSNSALDEVVLRTLKHGLFDQDGGRYTPSIVRVGVNSHHSVRSVTLDHLVNVRLGANGPEGNQVSGSVRDAARQAILHEASIVFSTLSFAGSGVLHRTGRGFDVVVIDEAAQAVEPSVLVPLVMGCRQAYLVGDPVQLPATVISSTAVEAGYDCSLFKRLQTINYPVRLLEVQYRMHPDISMFPSKQFYNGRLQDWDGVLAQTQREWHQRRCFGPFVFYDVQGKEGVPEDSASIENRAEAEFVLCLYRHLMQVASDLVNSGNVAIISPYKAQVGLLRKLFKQALGETVARDVDINTIDGFQGREKDVTIFSCVRSSGQKQKSIGFVADTRRINVGITRARCALVVVGNANSLSVDDNWRALIKSSVDRNCFYQASKCPTYSDYMAKVMSNEQGPVTPSSNFMKRLSKPSKAERAHPAADAALEVHEETEEQQVQQLEQLTQEAEEEHLEAMDVDSSMQNEEAQQAKRPTSRAARAAPGALTSDVGAAAAAPANGARTKRARKGAK